MICERGMTKLFSMVSLTKRDFTIGTLVTRIIEVLRIVVMDKFFHVMVPLEDMVKFMDTDMVRFRVLVCQV